MTLLALIVGCLAFLLVLRMTNAVAVTGAAARTAQSAASAMQSADLTDDQKEAHVRKAAVQLLKSFVGITLIGVAALAAPALVVWLGAQMGLFTIDEAIDLAMGWPFILGTLVVAAGAWGLSRARQRDAAQAVETEGAKAGETPGVPYGRVDRALHGLAFRSPELQKSLADIENRMYAKRIDPERAARPVFVTSLPRAGTTVMLDLLARQPDFASATYRHMPFTLAPLLWSGVTGGLRRSSEETERAHGDGLKVGYDSPEAFEEMVWMAFWADHYKDASITPWSRDASNPEFESFFRKHLAKVVAGDGNGATRYVSKNNANIARLPLLERMFPDANIVVPVRNPWAQAASLHRQHMRFLKLHESEPFARTYMEGLGHFEFGGALRPIAFGGETLDREEATAPEFWLRYWVDAYQAVLETAGPRASFVDHDALCAQPAAILPALAEMLDVRDPSGLLRDAGALRVQPDVAPPAAPRALIEQARALHGELIELSVRSLRQDRH